MIDPEVDALVTDRYLDALMTAADRRANDAPSDLLDPALRRTVRRLSEDLVRVHPSFRFEERLAARLTEAAETMRRPTGVATASSVVVLPRVLRATGTLPVAPSPASAPGLGPALGSALVPGSAPALASTLASAAITSAALSVGAAVVAIAWRRGYLPRRSARSAAHPVRA